MDDDLDTPGAMAVVFDAVAGPTACSTRVTRTRRWPWPAAVCSMGGAVGLVPRADDELPDEVARAKALDAARAERDCAIADAIRAELQSDGWVVETTPRGTRVRRPG